MDHVDLEPSGEAVQPRLELAQVDLSRFEGLGDLISLGPKACVLSSLVALPLAALPGFVFPLIPAVLHFGKLAHDASLGGNSAGPRPWGGGPVGRKMGPQHKMSRDGRRRPFFRRGG